MGVGLVAGADTHGRNGELARDLPGQLGGDHLHDDGERACLLHGDRVGDQLVGTVATALYAVATEPVDALRGEADVRHHRDTGGGQHGDLLGDALAAPEFDRVGAVSLK